MTIGFDDLEGTEINRQHCITQADSSQSCFGFGFESSVRCFAQQSCLACGRAGPMLTLAADDATSTDATSRMVEMVRIADMVTPLYYIDRPAAQVLLRSAEFQHIL